MFASATNANERLRRVFAPEIVGIPPANAFRDLVALPSGIVRHYGCRMVDGVKLPVFIESDDFGFTWRERSLPAGHPGPSVQSPWSGDWITLFDAHERMRDLHLAKPLVDLPPGLHVMRSKNGPDGPFEATLVSERGADCPRLPMPLRSRKRWLFAFQRHEENSYRIFVMRSDDDGRTWAESALDSPPEHVVAPPHKGVRWQNQGCEPTVAELHDGRLWMLIRTSLDFHWESFSDDGGETWSPVRPSPFHGTLTMPTFHHLGDGRLLLLWCNTKPLPELDHDTQPELREWERNGLAEDVFTNRDAAHAAISDDDGRTWRGFREILLNPCRNDSDFRTHGGNADSLDKSVHQFQAIDLPGGKVLVSAGQHETCRRLVMFDPDWLLETSHSSDFSLGLGDWSVQLYVKGIAGNYRPPVPGHCAYNRRPGAQLVPDPEPESVLREVLQIARIPDPRLVSDRQGAVWNFPALISGEVSVEIRLPAGSQGLRLSLLDHWRNPCDETVADEAAFTFAIVPGEIIQQDRWLRLVVAWGDGDGPAKLSLDGRILAVAPRHDATPFGLSYLHLQSLADCPDFVGALVRRCITTQPVTRN